MKIGVFCPIGNNGWLLSENAPQYKPTFELNKQIVQRAEHYGFDFALSMIKLRGFGGKTEFWDYNLETFTLMAGLAAVTSKIQIYATAATLVMPPAIVARMAATIESISNGRFGLNVVTGCDCSFCHPCIVIQCGSKLIKRTEINTLNFVTQFFNTLDCN